MKGPPTKFPLGIKFIEIIIIVKTQEKKVINNLAFDVFILFNSFFFKFFSHFFYFGICLFAFIFLWCSWIIRSG